MNKTIELSEAINTRKVDVEITDAVQRENINMEDVIGLELNGDGKSFLANDGKYKNIQGSIVYWGDILGDILNQIDLVEYVSDQIEIGTITREGRVYG